MNSEPEVAFLLLGLFDFPANLLVGLAQPLLQSPEQFIFLALGEGQIVVRQLPVFLL